MLTNQQLKALQINHDKNMSSYDEQVPVAYLFSENIDIGYQWLISEYDSITGKAYGIADLNNGHPAIGFINLGEIEELNSKGLKIINHYGFYTEDKLEVFKYLAFEHGKIIALEDGLEEEFATARIRLENLKM